MSGVSQWKDLSDDEIAAFGDYVNQHFVLANMPVYTILGFIRNTLEYVNLQGFDESESLDFIRHMLDGTGIDMSEEEILTALGRNNSKKGENT